MHGNIGVEGSESLFYGGYVLMQFFRCACLSFGQDGSQSRRVGYLSFVFYIYRVVDRGQALVVEQLSTFHYPFVMGIAQFLHGNYGPACLANVGEVDHGTCLARIVVLGAHGDLRQEGQGAFTSYHEVGNDVERVVEADEGQQVESCYVLDGIFIADAFQQFGVGMDAIAQMADAADEVAVCHLEGCPAYGVACVEYGAVGHYQAGREHHFVTVGMRAAVHA